MEEKSKHIDWIVLKKVLGLAKPYNRLFLFCVMVALFLAPISSVKPFLINKMIDDHIALNDIPGLIHLCFVYLVFLFLTVFLRYAFIYYSALLGQSVIKDLRVRVFKHISNIRLRFFDQTPIGKITTRTISDVQVINEVFTQGVLNIAADVLGIIAVISFMFYTSWRLALISIVTLPLMAIATYIFKEKVKVAFKNVRTEISNMNSFLQEQITGMQVVQMFNAEKKESKKFRKINRKYTKANLDAIEYYAIFFPVVSMISAFAMSLLVFFGAKGIWDMNISIGAFVAFPLYLNMLFRPVRMLADKFNTLQMGLVAAERVFSLLENDEIIKDTGTLEANNIDGHLRFENVSFAYDETNYVLNDISFELLPGKTMAIVGSTGSGKSTIINILNKFYEIQSGKIFIDNKDINEYKIKSLRDRVAMVLQDVFLFTGTVMENITLRDPSITPEQVIEASKTIGAHSYIEQLPGGYDFVITERGSNLSMGQKQLISFVRALVFDPDILILDEATSSIDSETEAIIQYAIEKLIQKRTSIIIAHRLSTIRHADNILVLDSGNIVEQGSHEQLLNSKDGAYRKLYQKQFSQSLESNV